MTDLEHVSEPALKLLESLEPENVAGYTVALGNPFDRMNLHGVYKTFDEALEWVEHYNMEEWWIVPIWRAFEPLH